MELIRRLKKLRHDAYIWYFRHLPIQDNKVILWSDSFKSYGCNPKYLAEYLLRHCPGEFDLVWVMDSQLPVPPDLPAGIRVVRYFSIAYLKELHTAHFIVCNARTSDSYFWKKRPGQFYVQTWHSSIRLKTIEQDAEENLPETYLRAARADSAKIDCILSGCAFSSGIFRNSFWYDGPVLECGTPRIDFLLGDADRAAICRKAGLDPAYRYILYAPTFRNDEKFAYELDFKRAIAACEEHRGGKWRVLYRLHPNLRYRMLEKGVPDGCLDVCQYSDMQELLKISDLLITDYSSCMFDMLYLKKQCVLYMPDYAQYVSRERRLYFDIPKLPFQMAYTEEALFGALAQFDEEAYLGCRETFLRDIGSFENGTACQTLAAVLLEKKQGGAETGTRRPAQ